ncbi:hypothetical protein TWF730_002232 [Orbilia blumenaviensis]|uniref:Uncharacterized protein n=1 Tax=Orbilia blumenaviensis TaxID=1796055 RepID=A0AAV9UHC4_9PEZI
MASRAVLHHAALKITPPPRTLRESREIYRSLRRFGEIDLYRSLRHEASTLEAKEDAVVLFRDEAALGSAFKASPISISMPTAQPSPIPSSGSGTGSTHPILPFSDKFTVEISRREHNHETRIIDQLFTYTHLPHSISRETPPGISTGFNSKSDISRAPDANEYRTSLTRSTGGGWKSWRLEMKQAGIPTWDSIRPTSDIGTMTPPESDALRSRTNSTNWGRQLDNLDVGKQDSAQPALPKSSSGTISNPTPLPLDPTLQPFRRHRQSQVGDAYGPNLTTKPSGSWLRSTSHPKDSSFQPSSRRDRPTAPAVANNSNEGPAKSLSTTEGPTRSETQSAVVSRALGSESVGRVGTIETPPCTANSGEEATPIMAAQNPIETNMEETSESRSDRVITKANETQKSQQVNVAKKSAQDISMSLEDEVQGQPLKMVATSIVETISNENLQRDQEDRHEVLRPQATPEKEQTPARKKWWSLPWQR